MREVDMSDGNGPVNYIEGIHPETGEVLRVAVTGNFPFKDPVTNKFIVDANGVVMIPGRERERFLRLDSKRREVPDPRPMSSAVAFAQDISPEEEVKRLIAQADRNYLANMARAEESNIEFYDDDFETTEEGGVDNLKSPFEFVRDAVAGCDIPRGLKGVFKQPETAVSDDVAPAPAPSQGKGAKPAKKAPKEEPVVSDEEEE